LTLIFSKIEQIQIEGSNIRWCNNDEFMNEDQGNRNVNGSPRDAEGAESPVGSLCRDDTWLSERRDSVVGGKSKRGVSGVNLGGTGHISVEK
jgi:hypothetical protein